MENLVPAEGGESGGGEAESRSLREATYEPEAHVEASYDFAGAESVEKDFTTLVDSVVQPAEQAPLPGQAMDREIDPATGEVSVSGGMAVEAKDEAPQPEVGMEEKLPARAEGQGEQPGAPPEPGEGTMAPEGYKGMGAMADIDTETGPEGLAGKQLGEGGAAGEGAADAKMDGIDRQLPEAAEAVIGMGAHGAVMAGKVQKEVEYSPDNIPSGSSTSGGGDPVGNYGTGLYGEDYSGSELPGFTQEEIDAINEALASGNLTPEEVEALEEFIQESVLNEYYLGGVLRGYTVEGDSPMPYTGSGTGHHKEIPYGPEFGPDVEAHYLRLIAGKGGGVDTKSYVGYGSSGSTSFSPGGGGEADDAGKFHGGLTASVRRPNNPDDPDYYTPNELEEALKAAK